MPIYIEENGQYSLDCSAALWSTDQIHQYYQDPAHAYGIVNFLCDVDFVIENETHILLVEYKNANISVCARLSYGNQISSRLDYFLA